VKKTLADRLEQITRLLEPNAGERTEEQIEVLIKAAYGGKPTDLAVKEASRKWGKNLLSEITSVRRYRGY
jgi:hypothetical protein